MNEEEHNKKKKPLRNWAIFTGIAFQMGVVITGGVFLGVWLDTKFENKYSAFTISCSLIGVFIALYQVYKTIKDLDDDKN